MMHYERLTLQMIESEAAFKSWQKNNVEHVLKCLMDNKDLAYKFFTVDSQLKLFLAREVVDRELGKDLYSPNPSYQVLLGIGYGLREDFETAKMCFDVAVEADKTTHYYVGAAYVLFGETKYNIALTHFEIALSCFLAFEKPLPIPLPRNKEKDEPEKKAPPLLKAKKTASRTRKSEAPKPLPLVSEAKEPVEKSTLPKIVLPKVMLGYSDVAIDIYKAKGCLNYKLACLEAGEAKKALLIKAEEFFTIAIELHKLQVEQNLIRHATLLNDRGRARLELGIGWLECASSDFDKAIKLIVKGGDKSLLAELYFRHGVVELNFYRIAMDEKNKLEYKSKTLELFKAALTYATTHNLEDLRAKTLIKRANFYSKDLKEIHSAISDYEAYLEIRPKNKSAQNSLAELKRALSQKPIEKSSSGQKRQLDLAIEETEIVKTQPPAKKRREEKLPPAQAGIKGRGELDSVDLRRRSLFLPPPREVGGAWKISKKPASEEKIEIPRASSEIEWLIEPDSRSEEDHAEKLETPNVDFQSSPYSQSRFLPPPREEESPQQAQRIPDDFEDAWWRRPS